MLSGGPELVVVEGAWGGVWSGREWACLHCLYGGEGRRRGCKVGEATEIGDWILNSDGEHRPEQTESKRGINYGDKRGMGKTTVKAESWQRAIKLSSEPAVRASVLPFFGRFLENKSLALTVRFLLHPYPRHTSSSRPRAPSLPLVSHP